MELEGKGRLRAASQGDNELIECHESGRAAADFDATSCRVQLKPGIVRAIMDEVVPMNLPSPILTRGKAVNLVCGNPASDDVLVILADSNYAWCWVGDSPVNAKTQDLEHSTNL
jgi:hypothetical protein